MRNSRHGCREEWEILYLTVEIVAPKMFMNIIQRKAGDVVIG